MEEVTVIIVGAGPSGLSTAACLTRLSIPYVILEREDCFGSLWKKYTYDRLRLHGRKQFSELPFMAIPPSFQTYLSKNEFLQYLENYVSNFQIKPLYRRNVETAEFDEGRKKWRVTARSTGAGGGEVEVEEYVGRFLVVASGATAEAHTPAVEGLSSFGGEILHSKMYKSGKEFEKKKVLVVGAGNSGMEIALDLVEHGALTSIIVRNPVHIMSRGMVHLSLVLLKYLPVGFMDALMVFLSKMVYGDLTKYGIIRPSKGPFYMKSKHEKLPIIDTGTIHKIKTGEIQVLSAEIESIQGNNVMFKNGKSYIFDSIIFCTGYRSSAKLWLKGDEYLLNEKGLAKGSNPNQWKGNNNNGLYCVGLSKKGLDGANLDAQNVANDISAQIHPSKPKLPLHATTKYIY